jgi:flavin reductase (DIM6/NTAB) family NADH-FMN oxidoreductase RutF
MFLKNDRILQRIEVSFMRRNFGAQSDIYPMPVFIVAAYDDDGNPNCMNAAWGGIYESKQIMVCLSHGHKTTKNIMATKAFTVNIADAKHVVEADYVGVASGNNEPDKMKKAGFTVSKSDFVNAPIINELPMAVECRLLKFNEDGICIGEIVNISIDEKVLGEDGVVDPEKLEAITFDPYHNAYLKLGEKVGNAFSDGKKLK